MADLISVIIPAKDCEDLIGRCLSSLSAQTRKPDEVIVINDCSTDRTGEVVAKEFPWVRLKNLETNLGFPAAACEGLKDAKGDWIALLNADAEADPAWLSEMTAAMETHEKAGMIACQVLLAEPEGTIDSLGIRINRGGMGFLREHRKAAPKEQEGQPLTKVFGPAGSACLFKREMLDECGFFEPDFFAYYDEVDLAFRCRWLGWKCLLAGRAKVVHRHSYTYGRQSSRKRYHLQRNRLRTIVRNWPASWLVVNLPIIMFYDLASIGVAMMEGSIMAAARARLDALRFLKKTWQRDARLSRRPA